MSPLAWRMDAAASSASDLAVAASSSCAWMRAVRSAIIFLIAGHANFQSRKSTTRNDSVPQMSSGVSGKIGWCDCDGSSAARIPPRPNSAIS